MDEDHLEMTMHRTVNQESMLPPQEIAQVYLHACMHALLSFCLFRQVNRLAYDCSTVNYKHRRKFSKETGRWVIR